MNRHARPVLAPLSSPPTPPCISHLWLRTYRSGFLKALPTSLEILLLWLNLPADMTVNLKSIEAVEVFVTGKEKVRVWNIEVALKRTGLLSHW